MAVLVSLITLGVRDLRRATAFYEAVGFERSSVSVDGVVTFFRSEGPVLALWSSAEAARSSPSASSTPAMRSESCSFIWHPKVRT